MNDTIFRPIRGTEKSIKDCPQTDGAIYYAYDTGNIYMDKDDARILMGGGGGKGTANGASIYYGTYNQEIKPNEKENEDDVDTYNYPLTSLEKEDAEPRIDDMILDESGSLYRIREMGETYFLCTLLPLSGSNGPAAIIRPDVYIHPVDNPTIVNGNTCEISYTVKAYVTEQGPLTPNVQVSWMLVDAVTKQAYYKEPVQNIPHGETRTIELTHLLKPSMDTEIIITAKASNHEMPHENSVTISSVEMKLQHPSSYTPFKTYSSTGLSLTCEVTGKLSKILECKVDGVVAFTKALSIDAVKSQSIDIDSKYTPHGHHLIEINLYQNIGTTSKPIANKTAKAQPLIFEIATIEDGNPKPIIWLGNYQNVYYQYDVIQIPYMVWDHNKSEIPIRLKKSGNLIEGGEQTVKEFDKWSYWQIADADFQRKNDYSIECGSTTETTVSRPITFTVLPDETRTDYKLVKQSKLKLNFDILGRSNNEAKDKRQTWSYTDENGEKKFASFENFNWYNNGWYTDPDTKSTFLRISNGARFSIPFRPLQFGGNQEGIDSNSIEMAFKIKNIQKYNNLITNVTRYDIPSGYNEETGKPSGYISDENKYQSFKNQTQYDNYDAYLQANLDPRDYENLKFREVQKLIDLNSLVCGFYTGDNSNCVGVCVGTQDTFFSNGQNTVNVAFVEGEMVYLSFVYEHSLTEVPSKLYIYINGCITGVIQSTVSNGFTIGSADNCNIVFNSDLCDIDLYSLRIYSTALNVYDIVTNYAVDTKNVALFDQNKSLSFDNSDLQEYQLNFAEIEAYNAKNLDKPLMPYIIYDTTITDDDKLPYAKKSGATQIKVEFINAPLEAAYQRGDLVQYAKDDKLIGENETDQAKIKAAEKFYYKHHCPSWTSTLSSEDSVGIEVQGTSSEFYPRRNFKIKTKYELEDGSNFCCWDPEKNEYTESDCLNIYMHKGPYAEDYAEDQAQLAANRKEYYGYEKSRLSDGWYMNNYTNGTDRWTMKVDYMESSGSYNAAFASMVKNTYTKHPLQDYIAKKAISDPDEKLNHKADEFLTPGLRWDDYRTSLLGFPVMAFQRRYKRDYYQNSEGNWVSKVIEPKEIETVFIGYYRMLLDKGSNEVLGFKPNKKVIQNYLGGKRVRDTAECWEFSTNARTFCSYKDPWDRVELSFKSPLDLENDAGFIKLAGNKLGGPVVLNHFEPRYHKLKDYLANDEPGLYNFGNLTDKTFIEKMCKDIGVPTITQGSPTVKEDVNNATQKIMANWEKVCKWVYSTWLENVKSQGKYEQILLGKELYEKGKYLVIRDQEYVVSNDEFDPTENYYVEKEYTEIDPETGEEVKKIGTFRAYVSNVLYQKNKYYTLSGTTYVPCSADFDGSVTYYEFKTFSNEEIAANGIADLLVAPATSYVEGEQYYTYNPAATVTGGKTEAVNPVSNPNQEDFDKGLYYVAAPKTYDGITWYHYDTKEYRTAKFMNELEDHFDLEYLSTYFIMTEVFECYDSRGKNCMMASWGPLEEGGDYIWYPIFYDIDTQLGINNTGIPSFTFNVDASDAKNYSTSDSILWNNFYTFFKTSAILSKYQTLRGEDPDSVPFGKLDKSPLKSVDTLEEWYTFNYDTTKNIADKGIRPLLATNLDMFFKYITITNPKSPAHGVAYIPGADGEYGYDKQGTYFYALQGDRSQSRRQFLTSRIDYIDSWLNVKNYARGGNNRIQGRIAANSEGKLSDKWIEDITDPNTSYWLGEEFTSEKRHDFDSEYWLTLTPMRSAYVTAGDDSMNYPALKYDGVHPAKLKLNDIEPGIRRSLNYPEQLVYAYGLDKMSSYGELYKMYWTEFFMRGNKAGHLTDLLLGYDGKSFTDPDVTWYNTSLNDISLIDMPLLKEANFSGLNITKSGGADLNLKASEKLENFRAVRTSNLNTVQFADGVALNTLYVPKSLTALNLIQANLLTNLIDEATPPSPTNVIDEETGAKTIIPPKQGLYIDGLFGNTMETSMTTFNFDGGGLGYGTYKILKRVYDVSSADAASSKVYNFTMKDVNWCPYVQLTEGAEYNSEGTYFIDDKHYGLTEWIKDSELFNNLVLNGQLYILTDPRDDEGNSLLVDINSDHHFVQMLTDLHDKQRYKDATNSSLNPTISGVVYVNDSVEENYLYTVLQSWYPNLTFFFENVTKAYSARFIYRDENGIDNWVKFKGQSTITTPTIQKIAASAFSDGTTTTFANPFDLYAPDKTHYKFVGWSKNPQAKPGDSSIITKETWANETITSGIYDYTYYAIFDIDSYEVKFLDGDGSVLNDSDAIQMIPYGTEGITAPATIPYKADIEEMPDGTTKPLGLHETWAFIGYTDNQLTNEIIELSTEIVKSNIVYYPVFEKKSVYNNINNDYFSASPYLGDNGEGVELTLIKAVQGKITIPETFVDGNGKEQPVLAINSSFAATTHEYTGKIAMGQGLTHVFFATNTKIERFRDATFFGHSGSIINPSKLIYVEFPDSLKYIGAECFSRCAKMDYRVAKSEPAARISGKNVIEVGTQAFQQTFTPGYHIEEMRLGHNLETLGDDTFRYMGLTFNRVVIGSNSNKSNLSFATININPVIVTNGAYIVEFHSNRYTDSDLGFMEQLFPGAVGNIQMS